MWNVNNRVRFEELKSRNSRKKLIENLTVIEPSLANCNVGDIRLDFLKMELIASEHIVVEGKANGGKVYDRQCYNEFIAIGKRYLQEKGNSTFDFFLALPDGTGHEISAELEIILRVLPKIYERYFQKPTGEYEDIIVVKPDYSAGLYFTVEEHRFFISAW